jgi:hypothetical protein
MFGTHWSTPGLYTSWYHFFLSYFYLALWHWPCSWLGPGQQLWHWHMAAMLYTWVAMKAFGAWLTWTVNQFDNVWLHWLCAVHICHSSSKSKHFIQL